ncbi:MAG TPA: thiol reductant ABC exporter subunit CydD [Anaerolineaceae bacterium]|nr:thiol reductant ABC exporter subunit CydD [Anaerolineaceae bacterium]
MKLDKRLLGLLRAERWLLILIAAISLGGAILIILQARLLSGILNAVFLEGAGLKAVVPLLGALLVIGVLRATTTGGVEVFSGWLAVRIKHKLRQMLLERLLAAGPACIQQENSGELTNTFINGVEALDAYYSQYLPQLVISAIVPFAVLLAVFPLDWLSGLVFLLTAPLIPFFMILVGKGSESITRRQYQSLSRMSAFFLDTLQGLRELKQWNRSKDHAQRISKAAEDYRRTTMSVLRVTFLSALVLELVATISTAVVAVQIGLRLLYGLMDFQQAFVILLLAPEFYQPLRLLGQRFHAGMSGVSAADRIFALMETISPSTSSPLASAPSFKAGDVIRFENVCLQFQNREMPALKDIHFELKHGEMLALVGSSGSGKTTIANLLMGFIQPQEGKIWINHRLLNEIDLTSWRKQIAWVGQRPYILHGTLRENLLLAMPAAGTGELEQAISLAHLNELIAALPQGVDTVLGEGGAKLSSGEAQRLALARAFLKNAPIVILDEPTAHLDASLERVLEESIVHLCAGRTVLMIAHRLPTVMRANRILVLQDGQIVEQGTHAELINLNGYYAGLVQGYGGRA